jgi:hypothetical protein
MAIITREFSLELLLRDGPIIPVRVGYDRNFNGHGGVPNIPADEYRAILDTGSSHCSIDSALARRLKLPIVGEDNMDDSGAAHTTNIHMATVHVPQFLLTRHGKFHAVSLTRDRHVLLGREFLQYFTMTYQGRTGTITLSND